MRVNGTFAKDLDMLFIGRIFSAIGALFRGIMNAIGALIPGGGRRGGRRRR